MSGVPDQPIFSKVEFAVQSEAEFNDAQVRGEMRRSGGQKIAEHITDLAGNLFELIG